MKCKLSLSTRTDSDGLSEVYIRFTARAGAQYRLRTGVRILPKLFNESKGEVVVPRTAGEEQRMAIRARKGIQDIISLVVQASENATETKESLTAIIENYHNPEKAKSKQTMTLPEAVRMYAERHQLSLQRARQFAVLARILERYQIYKGKKLDISVVDVKTIDDIEVFIRDEHLYANSPTYVDVYKAVAKSRIPERRGRNTIISMLGKLRSVMLWLMDMEIITSNPFRHKIIPEAVYGKPYYITIEERNAIFAADLSDSAHLAVQRDIFIFQCLIGCRVGDLMRFTKDNLVGGAIEYVPRKTKEGRPVAVRVPLNATAKEIVERYADVEGDSLLPFISEQKYNVAIKKIFTRAGITRKVTIINPTTGEEERRPINEIASSHLARRTFIGNLYKKVKDPNLIGALSGHREGSKAFARYRDIDEDMRKELVDMLE